VILISAFKFLIAFQVRKVI